MLVIIFFAVVLGITGMGFQLRKRHQPPPMDSRFLVAFGLRPGERHGPIWGGTDASGTAIILALTTQEDLVMNFRDAPGEPVRIAAADANVAVGQSVASDGPSSPSLTELTLVSPDQPPFAIHIDPAAVTAITRWATHHS